MDSKRQISRLCLDCKHISISETRYKEFADTERCYHYLCLKNNAKSGYNTTFQNIKYKCFERKLDKE